MDSDDFYNDFQDGEFYFAGEAGLELYLNSENGDNEDVLDTDFELSFNKNRDKVNNEFDECGLIF